MATHKPSMLGNVAPDDTGECTQIPYSLIATNDQWKGPVWRFGSADAAQPTVRHGIHGFFTVPEDYVGSAKVVPIWTSDKIAGDVEWDFDYRAVGGDDAESMDQAGVQESVNVADTAPSAAHERLTPSLSLTSGNIAAGDTIEFFFARDGTDAGDTLAGPAVLFDLLFEYADA